jgi:anti-anti-sigma regulatory factor
MEYTREQNQLVYTLKRRMLKMVEDCATTECRSSLSNMRNDVIHTLELLGFEDKTSMDLFFNKENND